MKTLKLVPFILVAFMFYSNTIVAQEEEEEEDEDTEIEITEISSETETIIGTYNGYDNGTYNFSYNDDGEDYEISFDELSPEAQKMYDLESDSFIGKRFEITYTSSSEDEEDTDDEETISVSVKIILSLKEL